MQLKSFLALIKLILIIDNKTKYSTDIYMILILVTNSIDQLKLETAVLTVISLYYI